MRQGCSIADDMLLCHGAVYILVLFHLNGLPCLGAACMQVLVWLNKVLLRCDSRGIWAVVDTADWCAAEDTACMQLLMQLPEMLLA